jgi:hypothetical protein
MVRPETPPAERRFPIDFVLGCVFWTYFAQFPALSEKDLAGFVTSLPRADRTQPSRRPKGQSRERQRQRRLPARDATVSQRQRSSKGSEIERWVDDHQILLVPIAPTITATIPYQEVKITATFLDLPKYMLTVVNGLLL